MPTVTVSTKFQIVIPREIRESLRVQVGQKFQAIQYGDRIELVPVKSVKEMRGYVKGIDTAIRREKDRA
ncbi:MAG TPA: AbrB/MazE/SpoVT family DNA-binding domain-containing protein [Spirochaetota bacterium]|nr:AbrB/MazE/SpoVT family DNA-binding domain-containing protein [Spirochaetota bacterium]HSA14588.1 AbrB/MazE/SpoVT family DNA-binding domain-containing protein [Spirochaetota bacterium]